jgi:tRNA splicing endonuclease
MALKYVNTYSNTCKVGNKTFKFKPWTTKNEKEYLIAVESEENITDDLLFDILVKPCLEDDNIILSSNEQKMLMIEIRKKSLGSTFPMRFSCSGCGQVNDIDVELDQVVTFKSENFKEVEVQDLIFEFGGIASESLGDRLSSLSSGVEYSFIEFLIHIKSITIEGVKEDTFSFEELQEFIENLPTHIFDEAYVEFQKMKSTLDFGYKTNCMVCQKENIIEFENIPSFLST